MEWKTVKLGEIGEVVGGATPLTKNPVYYDGEISWITPKDLANYSDRYISRGERNITEEGYKSCSCKMLPKGSVLFSSRAPIGYIAIAENVLCTNQGFKSIIPNAKKVDNVFLFYLLKQYKDYIAGLGSGTTFMEVSGSVMKNIELPLPPLETQRRIAAILSSLDDKIENNNRINRNLEAQAQALFKSWFVDFEPWGGTMPEGWKEGTYSDIIESTISGDWGKERAEGNYTHSVACIRGCDFEDMNNGVRGKTPQRYILEKNYQNKGLKNRDIVVEISGGTATVSTGRVCLITEKLLQKYDYDIVCTNFCRTIRPLADYYTYLYYSWKYKYDQKIMFGYENGTSGIKNFAVKDFIEKEPLIIPSCDIVKSFNKVISVLHDKIQENGTESQRLAALRDTLLPKLMRGEITL